jgi:hypothetical protein
MSGIFIQFKAPKTGAASAANTKYITREPATGADPRALYLHNLEHLQGEDYRETRNNIISFAETRLDEEQARSRTNPRESRTHYRAILSFDRQEDSEKARELAKVWLEKNFQDARAVVAVHQDKSHSHCHVWLDSTDVNDRKLQINNRQFKNLDKSWAQIYSKEYGDHYLKQHLEKKQETKKFKQEYRLAKEEGRATPAAPIREKQNKIQNSRQQERESYGFSQQSRINGDKRADAIRPTIDGRRKQDFERATNADEQASREFSEAVREAKKLHNRLSEVRGGGERANREFSDTVRDLAKTRDRFEDLGRNDSRVREEKVREEKNEQPSTKRDRRF